MSDDKKVVSLVAKRQEETGIIPAHEFLHGMADHYESVDSIKNVYLIMVDDEGDMQVSCSSPARKDEFIGVLHLAAMHVGLSD